jgi:hypothetical protein
MELLLSKEAIRPRSTSRLLPALMEILRWMVAVRLLPKKMGRWVRTHFQFVSRFRGRLNYLYSSIFASAVDIHLLVVLALLPDQKWFILDFIEIPSIVG